KLRDRIRLAIERLVAYKGFRKILHLLHTIKPKQPVALAQTAVPNQIPAPPPPGDSIWLHRTIGDLIVIRLILDRDPLALLNRFAQTDQHSGARPGFADVWREDQMRRHGV